MRRPLHQPPGETAHDSGSPKPGEPLFLTVGKVLRPHGVRGQALLTVITDFPERLVPGKEVFAGEDHLPLVIESVQWHQNKLLVGFKGVQDRDSVEKLTKMLVYVRVQDLPALPEGEYYHHQLLGLDVEDANGSRLGILKEILETGANDVYLVQDEYGKETLFPAIEDVILEIDLEKHTMRVRPPAWYNE